MAKTKALSDDDLKGIIARQITLADSHDADNSANDRAKALEYYNGVMKDTPAEKGRSQVVSRDVADTVGWILPGIMRVFTASDHMAKAEPVEQPDEQWAEQATEGVNFAFFKENEGYRILRDATWDALVVKNAIVKVWFDETPIYTTSFHSGLNDAALAIFENDPEVEVLTQTTTQELQPTVDPQSGQTLQIPTDVHEVKIRRQKDKGTVRVECIPRENYGKDGATTTDEAGFEYHRELKTRSELIKMGFDERTVFDLPIAGDKETAEGQARNKSNETDKSIDRSTDEIELYECYFEADVDGDNVSETVRAYYAGHAGGGVILDWDVWEDDQVFYDIPCTPIPHQFDAESIYDETQDVQQVKTVLQRQGLDNIYASNIPQRVVEEGSVINPDALFSPEFGEVIWRKKGSEQIQHVEIPFVAEHAFNGINYYDQVIQRRTGVNRQTAALDSQALTNQSATANQNERDASYSQIEQIARDMAELGWKRVFKAILRLLVKHQDKPKTIRLRDKWVDIDPRHWNADMDITMNVGLGTGSRDRDLAMLQGISQNQNMLAERLGQVGMVEKALEMIPAIVNTQQKMAESTGLKLPEQYFPEITDQDIQQAKQQAAERAKQGDPKLKTEMAKLQFEGQKMQADLAMTEKKMAMEAELKREQISGELALKREQIAAEISLKRELAAMGHVANANLSNVHTGGEPG